MYLEILDNEILSIKIFSREPNYSVSFYGLTQVCQTLCCQVGI